MNPGRYFYPGMGMGMRSMGPMMSSGYMVPRGAGLFSRIGNGIKAVNWSGLLNGANKTLNVVNQTIPLVRQARPMFSNMKSMFQLAKAFGNETTSRKSNNNRGFQNVDNRRNAVSGSSNINSQNNSSTTQMREEKIEDNANFPNFFV